MSRAPDSPYKGLSAFDDTEIDALFFFGRERENEIVVANLIASRLTVLYGPSGVGKSSLLRAAVARSLRSLPEEPLVVVFSRWSDEPATALADEVASAAGLDPGGTAIGTLERAQSGRDVYLVLDQMEEYFLYQSVERAPESFVDVLPAIVGSPLRVNVLVSLREDALAKLDLFAGRVPGLFRNTLRLDRLDRDAARAAIERPVERYAEISGRPVRVEPVLVEAVLDEVGAGRIEPALGGLGAVEGAEEHARIEAPYLQLVMQRLWDEERSAGSVVLRRETLEKLGGAGRIVEDHLHDAVALLSDEQKAVAARIFNHLVTPSGTKISHDAADLADFSGASRDVLDPVLRTLTDRRILRSLDEGGTIRFEIFHDVLAQPVLAWRAAYEADRELEAQKREADRRHRRLLAVIAVGAVLLAAMAAITTFALTQRSDAQARARESKASELEAVAGAELDRDPELSLALALEAARLDPGERAESALRQALSRSRLRGVVDLGEPVVSARALAADVLGVTEGGEVVVADPVSGAVSDRVATAVPAIDASFAADGTALVTGRDGTVRVVRSGRVSPIPGVLRARAASISADGTLAAVVERRGVRLLEVESGAVRHVYDHPGAISAAVSYDNRRVATGGADDDVRIWSGQSGRRIHTLTEHAGNAVALEFSPDRTMIATASSDGLGRVFTTGDWGLASVITGHIHALTDIGFSADSEHVVTAGKDGTAQVSHAGTGDQLVVLAGSDDWVTSAAFSGGVGSPVVTAGRDGLVRVWDAVFQPESAPLATLPEAVDRLEFDDEGHLAATTSAARKHVLDAASGKELAVESGSPKPTRVIGPNGETATIRGRTIVLESDAGTQILEGHRAPVTAVTFSDDGSLLVSSSLDHDARVWDVSAGELVHVLQHNTAVHDARFSPDGKWVVTAANRTGLWDVRDGSNLLRLLGQHQGTFTSATFDPTGRTIFTGSADGTVQRYECDLCGDLDALVALAESRLAATRRALTPAERERYLD
jgi:WD40 repeat protein